MVVRYDGYEDLDRVPLQYLSVPDAVDKRGEDSSEGATQQPTSSQQPDPSASDAAGGGGDRQARRSMSEPRPRPAPQEMTEKQKEFRQLRASRANSHDEYVMQQDKDANDGLPDLPDFSQFFNFFSDGLAAVAAYFGVNEKEKEGDGKPQWRL